MSTSETSASRAEGPAASPRPTEPRGRFDEALARARRRAEPSMAGPAPAAPRTPARPSPRAAPAERGRDAESTSALGPPLPPARLEAPPGICELQAAIRAAPPAIAAAVREAQPRLALQLGAALSIDLRASAQGLELSLRPSPALERAARAELPRLVDALRARGLRVARAEVAARPGQASASRAR